MKRLAIIPARGGSKRVPKKNIRSFYGQPIISYSICVALETSLFDSVLVSTDSDEICSVARSHGAEVPFLRSQANSNDHAGLLEVLFEVVENLKSLNRNYDSICCLLPTAPLIQASDLIQAFTELEDRKYDSVLSVCQFSYPIQRALVMNGQQVKMNAPENYDKRSQDLQPMFHDAGQFYAINHHQLFPKNRIFTDNTGAVILPESRVQDIDSEEDWKICELKYQLLHQKN